MELASSKPSSFYKFHFLANFCLASSFIFPRLGMPLYEERVVSFILSSILVISYQCHLRKESGWSLTYYSSWINEVFLVTSNSVMLLFFFFFLVIFIFKWALGIQSFSCLFASLMVWLHLSVFKIPRTAVEQKFFLTFSLFPFLQNILGEE